MEIVTQDLSYAVFQSESELSTEDMELFAHARMATGNSYAPYSRYHVGAAVRLANGIIFSGSNQENISFPVGLCAERVAIFSAMSAYPDVPVTDVAITARSDNFEVCKPVSPCGMCRQAIMEYEVLFSKPIRVILGGNSGPVYVIEGMNQLLPLAFMEKGLAR
jgi:cytidine deaminase